MQGSPAHPLQLGLSPLAVADWLRPESGDAALLEERARIVAAHEADVIGFLPEAEGAVRELARLLAVDDTAAPRRILAAIALKWAEDLLILIDPPAYRLGAGILC